MANYPFDQLLSPLDFEHLVRDLLSLELDKDLRAFAEGGDGGIDLRFSGSAKNEIVVQCKRTKMLDKLVLENEAGKVEKLAPKYYYIATSCELSVKKIDQIKAIFGKWLKSESNIYTKGKINQLLDKYPEVEQLHYKLWFNSSKVFNTLVNTPLYERSKSLISEIKANYKFYVKSDALKKSFEIINEHKFLVISGIPGIGKTTLAKMLLAEYLTRGYEIIEIRKIEDGEKILMEETNSRQVFYFDDFLGENFLKHDVLQGRSYDLVSFIKRVMANKNKFLIMTTREYILQQAKDKYEKMDSNEFEVLKYTLDLSKYSKRIKALILYNHLYYSNIDEAYINELLNNKRYKQILEHKNYSPRIIERMTVYLNNIPPSAYFEHFIENLNNPFTIWERAIEGQISDGAKFTLYLLLSVGSRILLKDFKLILEKFDQEIAISKRLKFNIMDWKSYVRELEGSFVKLILTNKKNQVIDFQNPSIKDFLLKNISGSREVVSYILNAQVYFSQFIYTASYLCKGHLEDTAILTLIENAIFKDYKTLKSYSSNLLLENYEFSRNELELIDRLYQLKFFVNIFPKSKISAFILEEYSALKAEETNFRSWGKYVELYTEFSDELSTSYDEFTKRTIKHIKRVSDIMNLRILMEHDENKFEKTINECRDLLNTNIKAAFDNELEIENHNLVAIASDLDENFEFWATIYPDYEQYAQSITEIIDAESVEEDDHDIIEPHDIEDEHTDDFFDEDEYFRPSMFERIGSDDTIS